MAAATSLRPDILSSFAATTLAKPCSVCARMLASRRPGSLRVLVWTRSQLVALNVARRARCVQTPPSRWRGHSTSASLIWGCQSVGRESKDEAYLAFLFLSWLQMGLGRTRLQGDLSASAVLPVPSRPTGQADRRRAC